MPTVDLGEIIGGGFNTWKKNLNICVPFILSAIISLLIATVVIILTLFSLFAPLFEGFITNPSALASSDVLSQIFSTLANNLGVLIIVFIIVALILGLINAFFTSGAIGMAKEAVLTGRSTLSHMTDYGKRKYLSFFGANIIVGLILAVGFVFLLPGILGLSANLGSVPDGMASQGVLAFLSLLLGLIPMVLYMLIMSIILALVTYAVVLDDLKAVEGVRKGIQVFWHNKLNVFLLWLIVLVFGFLVGLVNMIPFIGGIVMLVVMFIIFTPLTTIWWSKLYLTIAKT